MITHDHTEVLFSLKPKKKKTIKIHFFITVINNSDKNYTHTSFVHFTLQ